MAVVFDPAAWAAQYPSLASGGPIVAQGYFDTASAIWPNSNAQVPDVVRQRTLLYLLAAHIAAISGPTSSGLVGRISSATEGSVSVSTELNVPMSAAWFAQSQWGLMWWQATASLRTMRYVPGRQPVFDPLVRWR